MKHSYNKHSAQLLFPPCTFAFLPRELLAVCVVTRQSEQEEHYSDTC